jgi:uncharacterized membrane protein YdjX (TVP38/TMEM64 family)
VTTDRASGAAGEPGAGATSERSTRRRVVALRLASLAPLALLLALWLANREFRDTLRTGVELLAARDKAGLRAWGESLGWSAPLYTTALMIVQAIAAPLPAFLVTATNSLLFGWLLGAALSIASATLAALLCFALARAFGEPLVSRLMSQRARERADLFLRRHGASAILAARLVPLVPFDPISYLAGLSRVRPWTFTWATFVGQVPAGVGYSYLAQHIDAPRRFAVLAALVLAGLAILGWSVVRGVANARRTPS